MIHSFMNQCLYFNAIFNTNFGALTDTLIDF